MPIAPGLGSAAERQLRQACRELDRSLRNGRPDCAERYFAVHPLLGAQAQTAIELIYTEFTAREELGQRPAPQEYFLRFPRWKEALQRQFAIHDWLGSGLDDTPNLPAPHPEADGPDSDVPRWLGTYELLEEIGQGGCGRVYKAWQHGLERLVAVKVLLPGAGGAGVLARFVREAKVMARLRHPHILPIHDVAERRGVVYYSMAFIPGGALSSRIADPAQRPAPPTVLRWMHAVARAIQHAHERGVIHCDLKPQNILLDDDRPLLCDFGLAQEPDPDAGDPSAPAVLLGSPAYMAPEQITARKGAHAPPVDIWALGVLLYELLTGERPFVAASLAALRQQICHHEPLSLRQRIPALSPRLEAICARCLAKDPADRYPSAGALADDLAAQG
jgi:serine/threonine-protein kinase